MPEQQTCGQKDLGLNFTCASPWLGDPESSFHPCLSGMAFHRHHSTSNSCPGGLPRQWSQASYPARGFVSCAPWIPTRPHWPKSRPLDPSACCLSTSIAPPVSPTELCSTGLTLLGATSIFPVSSEVAHWKGREIRLLSVS